nr:hypothetical protein [Labrenzia sp. R5_0]
MTTQREVLFQIGLTRRVEAALEAFLNALIGLRRNNWFMLTNAHFNAPVGRFDISGIRGLIQQHRDALMTNLTARVFWEEGIVQ